MKDNNKKRKKPLTMTQATRRMLVGQPVNAAEEEEMLTPIQMVVRNFLHDRVAVAGVVCFLLIFLCCIVLPFFLPMDKYFQDVTQANVAPGFSMLKAPSGLNGNAQSVSVGSTFSVGIDRDGNVYEWGTFPNEKLKNIPAASEMGKVTQVSAGLDHILAVNEEGQLFTWGNDRMGLEAIPIELRTGEDIKQILACYQFSLALTEKGKLYNWGNSYLVNISFPEGVQGNIDKVVANTNLVAALTKDGRVEPLTKKSSAFTKVPEEIQGQVTDIAMTDESLAAVTESGQVYVWGNSGKGTTDIPEEIQGHVKALSAGRYNFVALLDDNRLVSWGDNTFQQANVPDVSEEIVSISSGYYGNYAISESGKVHGWGLKGYLMGTDDLGRDVFRRLLQGGRMTMTVGAIAVIISTTIGILVGGISG